MGATISVIGRCAVPACERPARVHVEVEIDGHTVRGTVCERCERATYLGAVLLINSGRTHHRAASRTTTGGHSTAAGRA